jgi:transcriptional regulator with XRE-family HTH domain
MQAEITQEQAAWDCDLSKGHLSQIEAGRGFPSVPTLFVLAKRLGVEVADIVCLDPADSRSQLLDAARTGDIEALRSALRSLGLLEPLAGRRRSVGVGRGGTTGGAR